MPNVQANRLKIRDWARLDLGIRCSFTANGTPLTARFDVETATGAGYWRSSAQSVPSDGMPRAFLASLSAGLREPARLRRPGGSPGGAL